MDGAGGCSTVRALLLSDIALQNSLSKESEFCRAMSFLPGEIAGFPYRKYHFCFFLVIAQKFNSHFS